MNKFITTDTEAFGVSCSSLRTSQPPFAADICLLLRQKEVALCYLSINLATKFQA